MTDLLGNEPDCNCHQCTWLRSSQVDRFFVPKPQAEAGNPVEEEILKIYQAWDELTTRQNLDALRALVSLARSTPPPKE